MPIFSEENVLSRNVPKKKQTLQEVKKKRMYLTVWVEEKVDLNMNIRRRKAGEK